MDRLIDDNADIILEEGDEVYGDDEEVVEENRHVQVYNPDRKEFDYTKLKAINIKSNPRAIMPGSRPAKEEAQMTARTAMIEGVVKEVKGKIQCIENLTQSERRGLKKLMKRVKTKR